MVDKDGKCKWHTGLFTPDEKWPPCFFSRKTVVILCTSLAWVPLGMWLTFELLTRWLR
jgi:hypothetical protein